MHKTMFFYTFNVQKMFVTLLYEFSILCCEFCKKKTYKPKTPATKIPAPAGMQKQHVFRIPQQAPFIFKFVETRNLLYTLRFYCIYFLWCSCIFCTAYFLELRKCEKCYCRSCCNYGLEKKSNSWFCKFVKCATFCILVILYLYVVVSVLYFVKIC